MAKLGTIGDPLHLNLLGEVIAELSAIKSKIKSYPEASIHRLEMVIQKLNDRSDEIKELQEEN